MGDKRLEKGAVEVFTKGKKIRCYGERRRRNGRRRKGQRETGKVMGASGNGKSGVENGS